MPITGDNSFVQRFVVLSAPQRSGTTALQSALRASPDIDTFFEIFHAEQPNVRTNFFYFLRKHAWAQQLYMMPKAANIDMLFLRYLRYLGGLSPSRRLIIDVKDNSLHNLNAIWHEPGAPPFLVRLFQKYRIPVLRIQRRNVFLQVISIQLASQHKKYHFSVGEAVPHDKVTLDPEAIHRAISARCNANARVEEFLSGCERCHRIEYEDIFLDNRLSPEVRPTLAEVFGTEVEDFESPLQKINPDPLNRIENVEEVLTYFGATPFRTMVYHALGAPDPDQPPSSPEAGRH